MSPPKGWRRYWNIIGEHTSEGGQAFVYKVERKDTPGTARALKRLRKTERLDRFRKEISTMEDLRAKQVLVIPEVLEKDLSAEEPYFVMPWYEQGSLEAKVKSQAYLKDPLAGIALLIKLAKALQQLHLHRVAHRDLKPANILLLNNDPHLADFGLCLEVDSEAIRFTNDGDMPIGSRFYIAPENDSGMNEHHDQRPADCYAFGKMVWALLAGRRPPAREWHREPGWRLEELVNNPKFSRLNPLLDRLLVPDPRSRITNWDHIILELQTMADILDGRKTVDAREETVSTFEDLRKLAELPEVRARQEKETQAAKESGWLAGAVAEMKSVADEIAPELEKRTRASKEVLRFAVSNTNFTIGQIVGWQGAINSPPLEAQNKPVTEGADFAPVTFVAHSPGLNPLVANFYLAINASRQEGGLLLLRVGVLSEPKKPPPGNAPFIPSWMLPRFYKRSAVLPFYLESSKEGIQEFVRDTAAVFLKAVATYAKAAAEGREIVTQATWEA